MNPDGVSYLDIGDAYWRHDWHNAINAYWSPLYSWILGFFINVVKPTPYWEYPLVHLVNFLIYVGALACFEFFLTSFVSQQQERDQDLLARGQMGIPVWAWYLLGYSLFIWTSLILMGLRVANPDLLVFAFTCLDFALLVRIHREPSRSNFRLLGVATGFWIFGQSRPFSAWVRLPGYCCVIHEGLPTGIRFRVDFPCHRGAFHMRPSPTPSIG